MPTVNMVLHHLHSALVIKYDFSYFISCLDILVETIMHNIVFGGLQIFLPFPKVVHHTQKRIKQLMEERSWTDYRLAKESGLSHSTVTNMFNRNNAPTLPTLEAVCKVFGITLAQFFSEGDEPHALTPEQQELFSRWSSLTDEQKRLLLDLMNTM